MRRQSYRYLGKDAHKVQRTVMVVIECLRCLRQSYISQEQSIRGSEIHNVVEKEYEYLFDLVHKKQKQPPAPSAKLLVQLD